MCGWGRIQRGPVFTLLLLLLLLPLLLQLLISALLMLMLMLIREACHKPAISYQL